MYEAAVANVHTDVRHLAVESKEQQISYTNIIVIDGRGCIPKLSRSSWHGLARALVGVVHESAAVETAWRITAVTIRYADLAQGN